MDRFIPSSHSAGRAMQQMPAEEDALGDVREVSDWIEHNGGPSPVDYHADREVIVRTRDGTEARQFSIMCGWFWQGWGDDVLRWKRIAVDQPETPEPVLNPPASGSTPYAG